MEDILAAVAIEAHGEPHLFVGWEIHGVLPADVLRSRRPAADPAAAGEHLKVGEVEVDGMMRVAAHFPDLGRAQAGSGGHEFWVKRLLIDHPAVPPVHVFAVEPKPPRPSGAFGVDGLYLSELVRH